MESWFLNLFKLNAAQHALNTTVLIAQLLIVAPTVLFLLTEWRHRKKHLTQRFNEKSLKKYYETFFFQIRERPSQDFIREYYKLDGVRNYVVPILLLFVTSLTGVGVAALIVGNWIDEVNRIGNVSEASFWYAPSIAAFLGAYCWVLYDHLEHLRRWDFTAQDMYGSVHRLLISVPTGLALAHLFNEALIVPGAFFIGAFPTKALRHYSRLIVDRNLKIDSGSDQVGSRLIFLSSIDHQQEERFNDAGYLNITQLAWANPLELCIRTGYEINFLFEVISEALLWVYFPARTEKLRTLGLRSAYEAKCLHDDLNSQDAATVDSSNELLNEIVTSLELKGPNSIKFTLAQVAEDPHTAFIFSAWQHECPETNL